MQLNQIFCSKPALLFFTVIILYTSGSQSINAWPGYNTNSICRERLLMDFGWHFAYGHPYDTDKDFSHATSYFSYFAKAGFGDGPASRDFDDRVWRLLDLPHDWAVEQPFDSFASHSHGYKTIGRGFPETSVGWYRKTFFVPESDLGRRISIEFEGVHRNSAVWVNGHYVGHEPSGYSSFRYDITELLNYGENNVVAVRVDVTVEEGWYYEGAGIYRHVWLEKTEPLHVAPYGTYITSRLRENTAIITVHTTISNQDTSNAVFHIVQTILDTLDRTVAAGQISECKLDAGKSKEFSCQIQVDEPDMWSIESPYLYKLITIINKEDKKVDQYETPFGIRTVHFDPDNGFFLNGKNIKLKGTNNHQDHTGVGTAIPDALQEYRIACLKKMGSNSYRCSHNPPTPALLNACDRLGMLVLVENRLMGTTPELLDRLRQVILRDRNHPSVIAWSLGNEEWTFEGNITGARIASAMQQYTRSLDSTRRITAAISGGWGKGISTVIDVMGYNYMSHGNIDEHHKKFPNQPGMATEESTTQGTRGIYIDNRAIGHMAPTDRTQEGPSIEAGWKYYFERPYLAGVFFWTGFDYKGESNPFGFPANSSQFGILDACGFPKDPFYYLKAWWTDEPVLHIMPHWNWKGREGDTINVWVQSNCDEVEMYINNKCLGKKVMEKNSHLEWDVIYSPGTLLARGYKNGEQILTHQVKTSGEPAVIKLIPDRVKINADSEDVSVITVKVKDNKGQTVPDAGNEIHFSISGPGKIIGVGNGNPSSLEPDKYIDGYSFIKIKSLKKLNVDNMKNREEVIYDFDDTDWPEAFTNERDDQWPVKDTMEYIVIRGEFELPELSDETKVKLLVKSLGDKQDVYVNGTLVGRNIKRDDPNQLYTLDNAILHSGKNIYAIAGTAMVKRHQWDNLNTDPGIVMVVNPAEPWKRKLFNGLAQVIVQSTKLPGKVVLTATSPGLSKDEITLETQSVTSRPAVP